jgi:hypothetical protein
MSQKRDRTLSSDCNMSQTSDMLHNAGYFAGALKIKGSRIFYSVGTFYANLNDSK